MDIIDKKIFYVNSANRSSGTISDFYYNLDFKTNLNYNRCVVLQASIPKSYYLVQENRNTFVLEEDGNIATIEVPIGNYSRSSLLNQVQQLLNDNSPNGYIYVITIPTTTINPETGHYTFTVSGNAGVQPQLIFSNNILHETLGFDINSTNPFINDVLISNDVVKLQLEDTLFIHSDICTNGNDNILQEIYTFDSQDYSNIVFLTPSYQSYSKRMVSQNQHVTRFYLTDENDVIINLNGQDWQFTLMLYHEEDVFKLIKNYLHIKIIEDMDNEDDINKK